MNLNVSTDDCHVDLYTMYNSLPNRTHYDYAVIIPDGNREDLSLNVYYPKPGEWYHAISSKTNCSFTIELHQLKTCPNNCSGNGECVDGECVCDSKYASKDCSNPIIELKLNQTRNVKQEEGQTVNYFVELDSDYNYLEFMINTTNEPSKYFESIGNAKVKYGRKPNIIAYNSSSDILQNLTNSIRVLYPEKGEWYLSVSTDKAVDYVLNPISEYKCPRNCYEKGVCDKGICRCSEFYVEPDCSKCKYRKFSSIYTN